MTQEWATLAAAFEARCLAFAFRNLGAPYIWGGKGDMRWDKSRGLRPWGSSELTTGKRAFDCSGLVTWAAREATAVDARAKWNAQAIHDATQEHRGAQLILAALRFYGSSLSALDHIAFSFEAMGPWKLQPMVLEASGGGSETVSEVLARNKGAEVRFAREKRGDCWAGVPLWALGCALGAVPRPNPPAPGGINVD